MADIVLTGNTSGAITVAAPAVAGTNTITLPAETGTIVTSATAAADVPKPTALSTASGSAPSYSARAWVNFNGSGAVGIRASGNVSSITDNATGKFQVNFTTAMPDADYAVQCTAPSFSDTNDAVCAKVRGSSTGTGIPNVQTVSAVQVVYGNNQSPATFYDPAYYYVSIFR
jgi:hypothetical protein|tara:strand:+ start:645 stop:1160 length:516 start_codon:yes stop_codon:yes gene_type:complete